MHRTPSSDFLRLRARTPSSLYHRTARRFYIHTIVRGWQWALGKIEPNVIVHRVRRLIMHKLKCFWSLFSHPPIHPVRVVYGSPGVPRGYFYLLGGGRRAAVEERRVGVVYDTAVVSPTNENEREN